MLTISGERQHARDEHVEDGGFRRFERRWGRFERRLRLPRGVDAERVATSYTNGVLAVVLPKPEEAWPRRIPVEEGSGAQRIEASRRLDPDGRAVARRRPALPSFPHPLPPSLRPDPPRHRLSRVPIVTPRRS